MIKRDTQDETEKFKGAINLNRSYWEKFFHLTLEERPDAIQKMLDKDILTTEKTRHWEVSSGLRGVNPFTRNLEYGLERTPVYFKHEHHADTLMKHYQDNGANPTITQHD